MYYVVRSYALVEGSCEDWAQHGHFAGPDLAAALDHAMRSARDRLEGLLAEGYVFTVATCPLYLEIDVWESSKTYAGSREEGPTAPPTMMRLKRAVRSSGSSLPPPSTLTDRGEPPLQ